MNAIQLLKEHHAEVKELFEMYEDASEPGEKNEIFLEIADKLAAHTTIEEKLFYPSAYVGELKGLLQEAVEEHLAAKRVIADLLDMEPSDEQFDAKVKVLKEQIEHHVEEEESDLFPKVRKTLSSMELDVLGKEMESMFEELLTEEPRRYVPSQTDEAAPLS